VIPLYGFLEGDTVGLVILAEPDDTAAQLAEKLQKAASVRVAPNEAMDLVYAGQKRHPQQTAAEMGLAPLDRIDVRHRNG
jgi:hypothetical protein